MCRTVPDLLTIISAIVDTVPTSTYLMCLGTIEDARGGLKQCLHMYVSVEPYNRISKQAGIHIPIYRITTAQEGKVTHKQIGAAGA